PRLYELLRRCLAKNRGDRWYAIGDVRLEIEAVMSDPHGMKLQAVREISLSLWRRSLPFAVTAILTAAVTLAMAVVLMDRRPSPHATITRFPFVLPEGQQFANYARARNVLTISPDGANIAYVANGHLYARSAGDMEARPLQGTQEAAMPFFSP